MEKKIIALTGLKGSGKDTFADYVIQNYPCWEKDSFAGTLKDAISVIFGLDRKMLAGETEEDRKIREIPDGYWSKKLGYDITPRIIMQRIGTDVLRTYFDENIWIYSLERKIVNSNKNVIITDCRFKNEVDALRKLGAVFIRIEREPLPSWFNKVLQLNLSGYDYEKIISDMPELKVIHSSELDWIGYDKPSYILKNNGTFEEFYKQIREIEEL